VDAASPEVRAFTTRALSGAEREDDRAKAVRLFEAVRDAIRYDPYSFSTDPDDYRASRVVQQDSAFCVPKAILLAACLRAAGIPAEAGFADVRNHLNSPRLAELMGTDVFMYHGYVQLWLGEETFKVTPAFNMELCERFGVRPLIFDGRSDALFHEFDAGGRRHMEYVRDRGTHPDAPVEEILAAYRAAYPRLHRLAQARGGMGDAAFDARG
jgi:transglutaminase-like putative cysteine protease